MGRIRNEAKFYRNLAIGTAAGIILMTISCNSYLDSVVPKIKVSVTNSDQMNMSKNAGAGGYARKLWAATTRYETLGYAIEKVQLEMDNYGRMSGFLPVKPGSKTVNVIIWDDEIQKPTPYGGSKYAPYSRNHKSFETKGYFTPCTGSIDSAGVLLSNRLYATTRLPAFGGGGTIAFYGTGTIVTNGGGPSNEVYTTVTNVSPDNSITVDYTTFILPTVNHCNCTKPLQFVNALYAFSNMKQVSDWALTTVNNAAYHHTGAGTSWWFSKTIFQAPGTAPPTPTNPPSLPRLTDTASATGGGACISRIK